MGNIWSSSKQFGLKSKAPSGRSPNFSPERAGGRGTKAGRGTRPGGRRVCRKLEAHLMAARQAGSAPTGWLLPGSPWLEVQRFGVGSRFCSVSPRVPPHRVRLPEGNVDAARAGLRAPPPCGGLIGGPCGGKGVRRPLPGAPPRPAAATMLLLLLYFSSLHFVPKFHSPHPQCPAP